MTPSSSFNELPVDIFRFILEYLVSLSIQHSPFPLPSSSECLQSSSDLHSACLVNRHWHHLALPYLYSRVYLLSVAQLYYFYRTVLTEQNQNQKNAILPRSSLVRELSVFVSTTMNLRQLLEDLEDVPEEKPPKPTELAQYIAMSCPALHTLHLHLNLMPYDNPPDDILFPISVTSQHPHPGALRKLRIAARCYNLEASPGLNPFLQNVERLSVYHTQIVNPQLSLLPESFPHLHSLAIMCTTVRLSARAFFNMLIHIPTLRSLVLARTYFQPPDSDASDSGSGIPMPSNLERLYIVQKTWGAYLHEGVHTIMEDITFPTQLREFGLSIHLMRQDFDRVPIPLTVRKLVAFIMDDVPGEALEPFRFSYPFECLLKSLRTAVSASAPGPRMGLEELKVVFMTGLEEVGRWAIRDFCAARNIRLSVGHTDAPDLWLYKQGF